MISRKSFAKIMEALTKHKDFEDAINKVFRDFGDDSEIMSCGLEGAIVEVIQEQFDDIDNDWLGYLCYEMNYLRDYKPGCITLADSSYPKLDDWNDVYDFLIMCMNEHKTIKE